MRVVSVSSAVISPGESVFEAFCKNAPRLHEGDIVCVVSKIVAFEQRRLRSLRDAKLSSLVRAEADEVLRDGEWALTVKDGVVTCNAGIDLSNSPKGFATLWPVDIWEWTHNFRKKLCMRFGLKKLGVVITDSRCAPRRAGVTGFALSFAGFHGVVDERGKKDLFGNTMKVTRRHVADSVADAAVLLMGETAESTPFAIVSEAPVRFTSRRADPRDSAIAKSEDLFFV